MIQVNGVGFLVFSFSNTFYIPLALGSWRLGGGVENGWWRGRAEFGSCLRKSLEWKATLVPSFCLAMEETEAQIVWNRSLCKV